MELRQLRYFVAVAEQGNISQAAKRIFLTQSALSRQIKALEDEIGQCLLERQAHSIRLTPVGEALLRYARDLLQHAEQVLERRAGRGADPACASVTRPRSPPELCPRPWRTSPKLTQTRA